MNVPRALQVLRKNHHIPGPETNRIGTVGNGDFAFDQESRFLFVIDPVERAGLAFPGRPGLTVPVFLLGWFSDDYVFYSCPLRFLSFAGLESSFGLLFYRA